MNASVPSHSFCKTDAQPLLTIGFAAPAPQNRRLATSPSIPSHSFCKTDAQPLLTIGFAAPAPQNRRRDGPKRRFGGISWWNRLVESRVLRRMRGTPPGTLYSASPRRAQLLSSTSSRADITDSGRSTSRKSPSNRGFLFSAANDPMARTPSSRIAFSAFSLAKNWICACSRMS